MNMHDFSWNVLSKKRAADCHTCVLGMSNEPEDIFIAFDISLMSRTLIF